MSAHDMIRSMDPSYAVPIVLPLGSRRLTSEQKKEAEKKLSEMSKEDHEMVTGTFLNIEVPGGSLCFPFRKYKEDPTVQYSFQDGVQYTIPRMVARHLNENCYTKEHEHYLDKRDTNPKIYDKDGVVISSGRFSHKKNNRFRFVTVL